MSILKLTAMNSLLFPVITLLSVATLNTPAASPTDEQRLTQADTGFAFHLLKEIAKEQPEKNIFISPCSASSVLQMVCNGAGGKTREEMQQVLGTSGLTLAAMNQANANLSQSLNSGSSNVVLNSANAIWYRKGISIKPEFISCNREFYQAKVDGLDFNDPASAGIMNGWVNQITHGRIPSIVSGPINPLARLFLANAVYFKGGWSIPFEPKDTKDRAFHLRGGRQKNLAMMLRSGDFPYRQGPGYQSVQLRYKAWNLAMYVFLPDISSNPEKLLALMNGDNWQEIAPPGFSERKGTLVLPRFKLEYSVDLKAPLRRLGLKHAFENADFSGMCDEPVFISEAKQKTFVEVNEAGTEAAASTMMEATLGIETDPPKPFEMIVDRPFLVVIHHRASNTILFMGVIFDPAP
jgi:serine protease inhibitor